MNAPPDLSLGEMYDPMDGPGENERCVLTGFEPETSFVQSTDFGLQHVGIHGDEEHVMLTQIFREFGGPRVQVNTSLDGINHRDCGLCRIAQRDCSDDGVRKPLCRRRQSGLPNGSPVLAAQFEDVVFHEVIIDLTPRSTRLPGGDSWCVDNYLSTNRSRTSSLMALSRQSARLWSRWRAPRTVSIELLNCGTGQPMSVRNFRGANAAILIGASGWCSAC